MIAPPAELRVFGPPGHFYECPRWHDGQWWVSDFFAHQVLAFDARGVLERRLEMDDQPGGLGWLPDGTLLVVSMREQQVLRHDGAGFRTHADLRGRFVGNANDMIVDRTGVAYVGNFGFDFDAGTTATPPTCLLAVQPDGSVAVAADGLRFPNGCMITADGRTLIVNETFAGRHTAFPIRAPGVLGPFRVWAQPHGSPPDPDHAAAALTYAPDGGCLDARDRLWSADALGTAVLLIEDGGQVVDEVPVPEGLHPFACALGGPDANTLLVTAAPAPGRARRSATRDSVLLRAEVAVGAPG